MYRIQAASFGLFFVSGLLSVAYQLVAIRWLGAATGLDAAGVLLGHGLFLVSMGCGAWLALKYPHFLNAQTLAASALALLGFWSCVSPWLIPVAGHWAASTAGWNGNLADWWMSIPALLAAFFPGAFACGALFPALEQMVRRVHAGPQSVSRGYAAWTSGAAVAAMLVLALLIRWIGFREALLGIGVASLSIALVCSQMTRGSAVDPLTPAPSEPLLDTRDWKSRWLGLLLGLLAGGHQMVLIRFLSEHLDGTFITYGIVVSAHFVASALGAVSIAKAKPVALSTLAARWSVAALLAMLVLIPWAHMTDRVRSTMGNEALVALECLGVILVAGPTSFLIGALFASAASQAVKANPAAFGRWYGLNLIASGIAGWIFLGGVAPVAGILWTLPLLAFLMIGLAWRLGLKMPWAIAIGFSTALVGWLPRTSWPVRSAPQGERLLQAWEGMSSTVMVTEDATQRRTLRVNRRFQMGGTAVAVAQKRQADLPLLLHPNPRRALFLGAGTGITANRALVYKDLASDSVELLPEVLAVRAWFEDKTRQLAPGASLRFLAGDARRWVGASGEAYDVIAGDLFHPGLDGVAGLYTREHFERVRRSLREGGLFCQWLPVYQLDEALLKLVTRTFLAVFPDAQAWVLHFNADLPVLALVGGQRGPIDLSYWVKRTEEPRFQQELRVTGFASVFHLAGCFAAGPETLRRWAGEGAENTENRPRVAVLAPWVRFDSPSQPGRALAALLKQWTAQETAALEPSLREFIEARDRYLEGLVLEGEGKLNQAMEAYLEAAGKTVYFTPAYARCVETIRITAGFDKNRARGWWDRLKIAQPAQPLGRRLLAPLFE